MVSKQPTKCSEPDFVEIIKYLNLKTHKRFTVTEPHRKLMRARFKEGYEVADFKKAIDNQLNDEYFQKHPKYMRPQTLFNGKFDSYVNNTVNIGLAPGEMKEKPIERKPDIPDTPEQKAARKEFMKAMKKGDMKGMADASAKAERLNKEAG